MIHNHVRCRSSDESDVETESGDSKDTKVKKLAKVQLKWRSKECSDYYSLLDRTYEGSVKKRAGARLPRSTKVVISTKPPQSHLMNSWMVDKAAASAV